MTNSTTSRCFSPLAAPVSAGRSYADLLFTLAARPPRQCAPPPLSGSGRTSTHFSKGTKAEVGAAASRATVRAQRQVTDDRFDISRCWYTPRKSLLMHLRYAAGREKSCRYVIVGYGFITTLMHPSFLS